MPVWYKTACIDFATRKCKKKTLDNTTSTTIYLLTDNNYIYNMLLKNNTLEKY